MKRRSLGKSLDGNGDETAVCSLEAEGKDVDESDKPLRAPIGAGEGHRIGEGVFERAAARGGYRCVAMHLLKCLRPTLGLEHETGHGRVADGTALRARQHHILDRKTDHILILLIDRLEMTEARVIAV